jgi:hypothetical protein
MGKSKDLSSDVKTIIIQNYEAGKSILRACEYPCRPVFSFCYFAVDFRCHLAHDIFLPLHTRLPCLAEDLVVRFSSFIILYNDRLLDVVCTEIISTGELYGKILESKKQM